MLLYKYDLSNLSVDNLDDVSVDDLLIDDLLYLYTRYDLLRGTIVNRTYGRYKNLYIYLFLLTIYGPIYCGPP